VGVDGRTWASRFGCGLFGILLLWLGFGFAHLSIFSLSNYWACGRVVYI
jgi:hypothetical protein